MRSLLSKFKGEIILLFVLIVYSYNYFNNTFPLSEGWFINYVELIKHGKIPYKDFYYYLPPLNLLIDYVFWKLSFGYLLIFRGLYLLQRYVIYVIVYRLLKRYFSEYVAIIACSLSEILCTADEFDYFGDYNQTAVLLMVLLVDFSIKYINRENSSCRYLYIFGVVLGLAFLCKQTMCITAILYTIISFSILKYYRYNIQIKPIIVGMFIPIITLCCYMIYHGALMSFIDQVFISTDGKGSLIDILLLTPLKSFRIWLPWSVVVLALMIFHMCTKQKKCEENNNLYMCGMMLTIMLILMAHVTPYNVMEVVWAFLSYATMEIGILLLTVGALIIYCKRRCDFIYYIKIIIVPLMMIGIFGITMNSIGVYSKIYDIRAYSYISTIYNPILLYGIIIFLIWYVIKNYKAKCIEKEFLSKLLIAIGSILLVYTSLMAAGVKLIPSNSMRLAMPFALCVLFSIHLKKDFFTKLIKCFVLLVSFFLVLVCVSEKSVSPYPWWGMWDPPKEYRTYSIDIPAMKGILLREDEKEMYEGIYHLILDNTSKNDIIFGYPYIKIYNIICDRYNSYFVPVFWYDVVADKYVDTLIDELEINLPKVVIWKDIPGSIEAHENIYRRGKKLHQRQIEEMFEEYLPEKYELLGEFNDIQVYKLKE